MANNYLQFSSQYKVTPEQSHVFEVMADAVRALDASDDSDRDRAVAVLKRYGITEDDMPDAFEFGDLGFQCQVEPDGLWIYAEESGDVDNVCALLSAMLEATGDDRVLTGTYSITCSKPRLDEFSGGWWAVSAKEILGGSAYGEVAEAKALLEDQSVKL